MDFAILENSKVKFIVGIFPTNWQQFEEVVVANRNVQVGDDYIMGIFYRNGERVLSPEEENANAQIDILVEQIYELESSKEVEE